MVLPLSMFVFDLVDINFIQNTIAIEGFINSANSALEIFCLDTGERLREHIGLGFVFDSDGSVYYIASRPHISPIESWGNNKIMNENGEVLFESEPLVVIRTELTIDGDMLSFYTDDIRKWSELWGSEGPPARASAEGETLSGDPITHHTIRIR